MERNPPAGVLFLVQRAGLMERSPSQFLLSSPLGKMLVRNSDPGVCHWLEKGRWGPFCMKLRFLLTCRCASVKCFYKKVI